jgi:hypothetical protein
MSKEVRIALIGVAGAIIAAIIGGLFALHSASTSTPTPTPVPKATASETLSEFCLLVQAHGLDTAYQLYSTNLKSSVSPAQFDDIWNKSLSNCTTNLTNSTDTTATGTIATTEFPSGQTRSYDVTLIKDNNGYWRIDSIK